MNLSVLDFWDQPSWSFSFSSEAERLGFRRWWVAEHPPQFSCIAALSILAGLTESLSVGTAGIIVDVHSPFQLAVDFRGLEQLFPGRIDAGICGGTASEQVRALMRPTAGPQDFVKSGTAFVEYVRGATKDGRPLDFLASSPAPRLWIFGTGARSVSMACELDTNFGTSLLHKDSSLARAKEALSIYRERTGRIGAVAVAGVCATTEAEAMLCVERKSSAFTHVVPTIVGSPAGCRDQLAQLQRELEVDEIMFLDVSSSPDDRDRSYRLLADVRASFGESAHLDS